MNTQHTPGPWCRNIKPASKYTCIFAGRNTHVAYLATQGLTDEAIEANCNLIAAAPDCYKSALINFSVLTTAYQYIKCTKGITETPEYQRLLAELEESIAITKAAIAKATKGE